MNWLPDVAGKHDFGFVGKHESPFASKRVGALGRQIIRAVGWQAVADGRRQRFVSDSLTQDRDNGVKAERIG